MISKHNIEKRCPSYIHVLCDTTNEPTADIPTAAYARTIYLVFWYQQWLVKGVTFHLEFQPVSHFLNAQFDTSPFCRLQP